MRILVTGSEGLVGTELCKQLRAAGHETFPLDTKIHAHLDVRGRHGAITIATRRLDVDGIVHLAAMVRVDECERNPIDTVEVNTGGVIAAVQAAAGVLPGKKMPWVLFTSSREVYGSVPECVGPVRETYPVRPVNVYGRAKALGEDVIRSARRDWSLRAAIVRLSSVYGSTQDHRDRVVPKFARAAAEGGRIAVCGREKGFDFVHVSDAARGLVGVCELLNQAQPSCHHITENLDVHLVSGVRTSLTSLAGLAQDIGAAGGQKVEIIYSVAAPFEVSGFVGDPTKAHRMLGWQAEMPLRRGFRELVEEYRTEKVSAFAAEVDKEKKR